MPRRKQKRGNPAPSGGGNGLNLLTVLGRQSYPAQPKPILAGLFSGRQASTDIGADRVLTQKPAVFILASNGYNWLLSVGLHYLCIIGASDDPDINNLFGTWSQEMYGRLVRNLMAERRILLRDTILDNTGTPADSLGSFMNHYSNVFCGLRGLEAWLDAGSLNQTTAAIAAAIDANLARLKGDLDRLDSIPMAPSYMRALDRLCGPKCLDVNSVVIGQQFGFGAATLDMTVSANIATILSNIEVELTTLLTTPPANMRADYQRILNTFAVAYGNSMPVHPKKVAVDAVEYALIASQAVTFHDTTAVKDFTAPLTALFSTGSVPILIPKDADHTSEGVSQLLSLWRPGVYSKDATTGVAAATGGNQFGLTTAGLTVGDGARYLVYNQGSTPTSAEFTSAGTITLGENLLNDIFPWALPAASEMAALSSEVRSFRDWDIYYIPTIWLLEETVYHGEQMFMGDMTHTPGGRS